MTKKEAIAYIMAKSDDWLCEKVSDEEFFEIIESYVKMVHMTSLKPEDVKCPECEGPMVARKGQYGIFWGCKRYPSCRGTRDSEGKSKEDRRLEKEQNPPEPSDERFRFRRG